jgi:hypothetical protein
MSALQADESGGAYYTSDFASVEAGDFPPGLVFKGGSMQVEGDQGQPMLRFTGNSWFHIALPTDLPKAFAIDFDYHTTEAYAVLYVAPFDAGISGKQPPSYSGYRQGEFSYFALANTTVGAAIGSSSDDIPSANAQSSAFTERVVPIRLEVKGTQARIYVDEQQVVVNPAARFKRTDTMEFFYASMGSPGYGYIGRISIEDL